MKRGKGKAKFFMGAEGADIIRPYLGNLVKGIKEDLEQILCQRLHCFIPSV
jgi:hypothetical protein